MMEAIEVVVWGVNSTSGVSGVNDRTMKFQAHNRAAKLLREEDEEKKKSKSRLRGGFLKDATTVHQPADRSCVERGERPTSEH